MSVCIQKPGTLPEIDMAATGHNIERLRIAAGLSARDLQHIFGFTTPQAIYKWQTGRALPTLDNLIVLARVLDVRMEDIIVCRETDRRKGGRKYGSDTTE